MATKEEKEAKANAAEAASMAVTQGRSRLNAEVSQAGRAFQSRPLRAGGDLSRYRIGGFNDDPSTAPKPKPAVKPKPKPAAKRAPTRQSVVKRAPVKKAPTKKAVVKKAPAKKAPVSKVQHAGWKGWTGQKKRPTYTGEPGGGSTGHW